MPLAAGTYAISVDGVGYGDPASSGYSDYASLGSYRLTTSWTAAPAGTPSNHLTATSTVSVSRSATKVSGTAMVTVTDSAFAPRRVSGVNVTGTQVRFCVTDLAKSGYTYTGGTQCTAVQTV